MSARGSAHDHALHRLRALVDELGAGGGAITPAVYDTARTAALLPHRPRTGEMLHWLTTRQQPDGGWGDPLTPHARDLPTLAAVLALTPHPAHRPATEDGIAFLHRHAAQVWNGPVPQDIPVGLELLLPPLLAEARTAHPTLPTAPYDALRVLGKRRRQLIAQGAPHAAGTAAVHSWEGWGRATPPLPLDGSGGVGHSPAATATALHHLERQAPAAHHLGRQAPADTLRTYLARATANRPPLLPTVWPIDVFERTWALHALALAGLLDHPHLATSCARQLDVLQAAYTPAGLGMSEHFMPDGDITATASLTLALAGRPSDPAVVERFRHDDHYRTYPGELQPSLTTTAHALHARTHADPAGPTGPAHRFLRERQDADGRWSGDKWHTSWIYTTAQVMFALPAGTAARRGAEALLGAQRPDGGWGAHHRATAGETGYAVLALLTHRTPGTAPALARAAHWLARWQESGGVCDCHLWTGKETYCPQRIDRVVAHAAFLAAARSSRTRPAVPTPTDPAREATFRR
ncbi:prenyltransferase/squalene oxidase repeat-containing protein [Kitasatospora sp. NPDC101447]|uniref:prenyltransferase/squalene oxidase repeat-containing protein n=1 Tax=Kitasatospora sp. NPDC101447 TaxID=3364102 RepID=UPI00382494C9